MKSHAIEARSCFAYLLMSGQTVTIQETSRADLHDWQLQRRFPMPCEELIGAHAFDGDALGLIAPARQLGELEIEPLQAVFWVAERAQRPSFSFSRFG